MPVKYDKKRQKFLNNVFAEISNIVTAYTDGHIKNSYELKKNLYESVVVHIKQSYINGIKVGRRQKQK